MTTFNVSNVAQLESALSSAQGGDTISLAAGTYSGLGTLSGLNYSSNVTITSATPSNQAVLSGFYLSESSNITFSHLTFSSGAGSTSTDPAPFRVYNSSGINFGSDVFHSVQGISPSTEVNDGLDFFSSSNVSVTNSDFSQLENGMQNFGVTNGNFSNNAFHEMGGDGIDDSGANGVTINNNVFTDFVTTPGVHADAIQFWTAGTTVSNQNVTVSGNLMARGAGDAFQGVFMGDDSLGSYPFENVTISNNILVGPNYDAIALGYGDNINVLNNTVASYSDIQGEIWVNHANGLTEENNTSSDYYNVDNTSVTSSGNVTNTTAVTDSGKALVTSWISQHEGWTGPFPTSLATLTGESPTSGSGSSGSGSTGSGSTGSGSTGSGSTGSGSTGSGSTGSGSTGSGSTGSGSTGSGSHHHHFGAEAVVAAPTAEAVASPTVGSTTSVAHSVDVTMFMPQLQSHSSDFHFG